MSTTQDREIQIGSVLSAGRYAVQSKLGEGGMGFVYRARDNNLGADVVIKVPRRAMLDDPEFVERFQLEIQALVKLVHPHVVRITDVGRHGDYPYAVMHYLEGGSLDDRRAADANGDPLPQPSASLRTWLDTIAKALDFVHGRGYVHRDVKPANILFDEQGHAFLGDFGVIKAVTSTSSKTRAGMTGTGLVLGTPEYMAPEIILGRPFDGRADQYALAITVYEMLCGRRPFESEAKTEIIVQHTAQEPPRLRDLCAEVRLDTSEVVHRALAKDPELRYPDCLTFARAILETIEDSATADPFQSRSQISTPSTETKRLRLACPSCGAFLKFPDTDVAAGQKVACPKCQQKSKVSQDRDALEWITQASASGDTIRLRPEPTTTAKQRTPVSEGSGDSRVRPAPTEPQVAVSRMDVASTDSSTRNPRGKTLGLAIGGGVAAAALVITTGVLLLSRPGSEGVGDHLDASLEGGLAMPIATQLSLNEAEARTDDLALGLEQKTQRERLVEEKRLADLRNERDMAATQEQAAQRAEQFLNEARQAIEQKDKDRAAQLLRTALSEASLAGGQEQQKQAQSLIQQMDRINLAQIRQDLATLSADELIALRKDNLVLAPADIQDEGIKLIYEAEFRPLLEEAIRQLPPISLPIEDFIADPGQYVGQTIEPTGYFEVGNRIERRNDGHYATRFISHPGARSQSTGDAQEVKELIFIVDRSIGESLESILEQNRFGRRESIRCIIRLQVDQATSGWVARITELTIALIPDLFGIYQFDNQGRAVLVEELGAYQLSSTGIQPVELTPQEWEARIGPADAKSIRGRKERNLRESIARANLRRAGATINQAAREMADTQNQAQKQQVDQMRSLLMNPRR